MIRSSRPAGDCSLSNLIETRAEFQELARVRLEEAKSLLDLGKWRGAYYLAGYAIELALKACIIKTLMATDAFPDKEFSKTVVNEQAESGKRLIQTLVAAGFEVRLAFWAKPTEEGKWYLYLASPVVDE